MENKDKKIVNNYYERLISTKENKEEVINEINILESKERVNDFKNKKKI